MTLLITTVNELVNQSVSVIVYTMSYVL